MRTTARPARIVGLPLLAAALLLAAGARAGEAPTGGPLLAQADVGILKVTCEVDGATVLLDGEEVGVTPLMMAQATGSYQLTVEAEGYAPYTQAIEVRKGKKVNVAAALQLLAGSVLLDVTPDGATVLLDGTEMGTTPELRTLDRVMPGEHTLVIRKDAHETYETSFKIAERQQITITASLDANAGVLVVSSVPDGATVYGPGGEVMGTTPLRKPDMVAGLHTLRLTCEGYADAFVSADVVRGNEAEVEHVFSDTSGRLRIIPDPDDAQVSVDRYVLGTGEQRLEAIKPGIHELVVTAPDRIEFDEDVLVQENQTTTVRPNLLPLDSNRITSGGRVTNGKKKAPVIIAIVGAVTAGTVIAIAAANAPPGDEPLPPTTDYLFQLP